MTTPHDPEALLADLGKILRGVDPEERRAFVRALHDARAVFLAGAGRSGLIVRAFAMRLTHLGLRAHVVGEPTCPAIGPGDLLVVGSGSGRTESMLGVAGRAVGAGARLALVTGAILAPLTRLAHLRVVLPPVLPAGTGVAEGAPAPDPHALFQPMRTLFEQALLVFLDLSVLDLMALRGAVAADMERRHSNLD